MTAAINSTGAGKRGYPTKSSVPQTQASTQRRARERSVAIQTLLLVRKSKSRSEERFSRNAETDLVCRLLLEKKKKKLNRISGAAKRIQTKAVRKNRSIGLSFGTSG